MNYIDYIRQFWARQDALSLTVTETALYLYLLECCNRQHWPARITRSNDKIEAALNISYKILKNARIRLQEVGLLRFTARSGTSLAEYALTSSLKDEVGDEVRDEVGDEVRDEVGDEVDPAVTNVRAIRQRQRQKKEENNTPRPPERETEGGAEKKECRQPEAAPARGPVHAGPAPARRHDTLPAAAPCPPYVEPAYRDAFVQWLQYKQARREPYRSARALQLCYRKLCELSRGDPARAADIVETAMANNYAGLYPLTRIHTDHQPKHPFTEYENNNTRYHQF